MKRNKFRQSQSVKSKLSTKLAVKAVLGAGVLSVILFYIVTTVQFFKPEIAVALAAGDYQSTGAGTGTWSTAATWQRYNGTGWVAAPGGPSSLDGQITIRSGHTVTISSLTTADQVVISPGATLILNNGITLTLMNGTATDLDVSGVFKNSGAVTSTGALIVFQSTGKYQHSFTSAAGTIPTATWNAGSTCEIINTGSSSAPGGMAQTFSNFTWNCASQSADVTLSGAPSTVTGTYSVISTGTKKLRLASGNSTLTTGNFIQSGGDFGLSTSDNATTTLNVSSNFSMTGGTFSFGSGKDGFCNMNITGNWLQSGGAMDIEGEKWRSTIIINGNWSQTNGTFTGSDKEQITTITVNGNWSQAGGTFTSNKPDQTCTFNIYGNYSHTGGTISEAGSGTTNILFIFKDTGTQTFTASANTVTGDVDFTVNSGSILVMGNNIMKGRNFTLSSGAELQMGSAAGITSSGATGNIQVSGTRSFNTGAYYTYNGAAIAQVTGNGLQATIARLTINNSGNVTLTGTVSVSNLMTFTSGKLITNSNELRVTNSATGSITGYSSSSYVIGNLRRTVAGTGVYDFPLGTTAFAETASITFTGATGISTLLGKFTNANPVTGTYPLIGIILGGLSIDHMLNYGYWTLTPTPAMTGGTYSITVKEQGYTPPTIGHIICVLKRANVSSSWQAVGVHDNSTQSEIGGVATAVTSEVTSFSDFGIGYGENLQFFHPVLISGVDKQLNAIYLFQDVCSDVDAWVQIVQFIKGASLDDIDHYTDGYDQAWQPFIVAVPNDTSAVKWQVTFKVAGTATDTVLPYVAISAIDVDGDASSLKEFVEANNIYSYAVNTPTNLTITRMPGGSYRARSQIANVANIDTAHHEAIFQLNFMNLSSFTFTTGAISTSSGTQIRQNCLFFAYFFNGNVALPVKLSSFTVTPVGKEVEINWSTAAEINNDYFTLERSVDGKQFSELSKIKGSGSSSIVHKYSFTDGNPFSGLSYYRLKQTDYNGISETFRPVSVSMGSKQIAADEFRVFPNPFKEYFTVQFKSEQAGEMELQLLNYSGTKLFSQVVAAEEGTNNIRFAPAGNIVPGLYILRVSNNKEVLADLKVLCKK